MLQIMAAFSTYLDVPEEHLKDTAPCPPWSTPTETGRSGADSERQGEAAAAFAAVHYRDYWFWIDDGDFMTKRAMTAVMFFFTLSERRHRAAAADNHPAQ